MENIEEMIEDSDYMRNRDATVTGNTMETRDILRIIFSDKR